MFIYFNKYYFKIGSCFLHKKGFTIINSLLSPLQQSCVLHSFKIENSKPFSVLSHMKHFGTLTTLTNGTPLNLTPPYLYNCVLYGNEKRYSTRCKPPWKILFFGTDDFSTRILQSLINNRNAENKWLISKLDVVSIRGETAVRKLAVSAGLLVMDWPTPDLSDQYDLGILASFGHMIPSSIINYFPLGIYNVHPSLLPRWRGASPIVHTIIAGDDITGVSIMKLKPKRFDIGGIVSQLRVPVPEGIYSSHLRELLAQVGGDQMIHVLRNIAELPVKEQDNVGATYATKAKRSMAYLDWKSQKCSDIDKQFRALAEFGPLRSELSGHPVKLLDFQPVTKGVTDYNCHVPGTIVFDKSSNSLFIKCQDGWVSFLHIILKKKMTAQAFYNGYLSKTPDRKLVLTSLKNGLDQVLL